MYYKRRTSLKKITRIKRKELPMKDYKQILRDFERVARRYTSLDPQEVAAQCAFEFFLKGTPDIEGPRYYGFVRLRCLREIGKMKREREVLSEYRDTTAKQTQPEPIPSENLKSLSEQFSIVKYLIEGMNRREIAKKEKASLGWVQREIDRIMRTDRFKQLKRERGW